MDLNTKSVEALNPFSVHIATSGPFQDQRQADGSAEDHLEELAISLLCNGQLQPAVAVEYDGETDGEKGFPATPEFTIAIGRRRTRACRLAADWRKVILDYTDEQLEEWADDHEIPFPVAQGLRDQGAPSLKVLVVERDEVSNPAAIIAAENAQRQGLTKGELIEERYVVFREALKRAKEVHQLEDEDAEKQAVRVAAAALNMAPLTLSQDVTIAKDAPASVKKALRLKNSGMGKASEIALLLRRGDKEEIKALEEKAKAAVKRAKENPEEPQRKAKSAGKKTREAVLASFSNSAPESDFEKGVKAALEWVDGQLSDEMVTLFQRLNLEGKIFGIDPAPKEKAKPKAKGKKTAGAKKTAAAKAKAKAAK